MIIMCRECLFKQRRQTVTSLPLLRAESSQYTALGGLFMTFHIPPLALCGFVIISCLFLATCMKIILFQPVRIRKTVVISQKKQVI